MRISHVEGLYLLLSDDNIINIQNHLDYGFIGIDMF